LTELAADVAANPDALGRLLRYLAARGVFAEIEPNLAREDHVESGGRHPGLSWLRSAVTLDG